MSAVTRVAPLLVALAVATLPAAAAADVWWAERDDEPRWEGLVPDELVAGNAFELLGVQIVPAGFPADAAGRLELYVPADAPADVHVEVRERPSNYRMRPEDGSLEPGRPFHWPLGEVLGPAGIAPERLCALANREGERFYYPVLLGGEGLRPERPRYEFRFYSRGEYALRWVVRRETPDGMELVVAQGRDYDGLEGLARVAWPGLDGEGRPAPPGRYVLDVQVEVYLNPTERLQLRVPFQHYDGLGPAS